MNNIWAYGCFALIILLMFNGAYALSIDQNSADTGAISLNTLGTWRVLKTHTLVSADIVYSSIQWYRNQATAQNVNTKYTYYYTDGTNSDSNINLLASNGGWYKADYNGSITTKDVNYVIYLAQATGASADTFDWKDSNVYYNSNVISVTADFNYSINPSSQTMTLISTSTDINAPITDWNWLANSSTTHIADPNANQTTLTNLVERTDYNICLSVGGIGTDTNFYRNTKCQTINSGKFFGDINFYFYNETNKAALSVTTDFNGTLYTGTTFLRSARDITNDANISQQYTFNFIKTGYLTRTYTIDLNQYSDLNINFGMINDTNGLQTTFQFFAPDQITRLANADITVKHWATQLTVGRGITDIDAKITFGLNTLDGNYMFHIVTDTNTYDYNSLSLVVRRPKDEATAKDINANWNLEVTGVAIVQDYNITSDTNTIIVYSNTNNAYLIRVSSESTSPIYFARNYAIQLFGNPTTYNLQPYLISNTTGLLFQLHSLNPYTLIATPSITVKVYRLLQGQGKVLVEQEITDGKGDAFVSMILNQQYIFDVYDGATFKFTANVVGAVSGGIAQTIYVRIADINADISGLEQSFFTVNFFPTNNVLHQTDVSLQQAVQLTDLNEGIVVSAITVFVTNTNVNNLIGNDVNVYQSTTSNPTFPFTNSIPINQGAKTINGTAYDANGELIVHVRIVTNQGTITYSYVYTPYHGQIDFLYVLSTQIKPMFGCPASGDGLIPCPTLLLAALFISIGISVVVSISMGYVNLTTIGLFFLLMCGIFTYITWIPYILFVIMVAGTLGIIFAEGGRRI